MTDAAHYEADQIYRAAQSRVGDCGVGPAEAATRSELEALECIVRAMLEVLTPEQRAEVRSRL